MKIASVADVKAHLSAYIKASEDELVVITKNGKPVAVLLPMDDDDELERLALAYSKRSCTTHAHKSNLVTASPMMIFGAT